MIKKTSIIIFSLIFLAFLLNLGSAHTDMNMAGACLGSTQFETAYVIELLFEVEPSLESVQDAVDYLIANQDPDGSFNGDIYQTAVGAQGLNAAIIDAHLWVGLNLFGYQVAVPKGYTSYNMIEDSGGEDQVEMVQRYNPTTGTFERTFYDGSVVSGDEFSILSGEGYYVYMKAEKTASQRRPVVDVVIQLQPELNVTAVPCTSSYTSQNNRVRSSGAVAQSIFWE